VQPDETNGNQDRSERWFGRSVRERREQLGMSQRELAEKVSLYGHTKMDPTAVTRMEKGQRAVRLGEALTIAGILKMPLAALVANRTKEGLERRIAEIEERRAAALNHVAGLQAEIEALQAEIAKLEQAELEDRYYGTAGED
jgi:transcriptional regulator with XRE-family HTH domain